MLIRCVPGRIAASTSASTNPRVASVNGAASTRWSAHPTSAGKIAAGNNFPEVRITRPRHPAGPTNLQPSSAKQPRRLPPDPPSTNNQRLRAKHTARLPMPPLAPPLQIQTPPAVLRVRDHRPQHVLRDRPVKHPMRIRDHNIRIPKLIKQQRVDPRRRHMDPLQRPRIPPNPPNRRRKEVPQHQPPSPPNRLRQPIRVTEPELDCQPIEPGRHQQFTGG